MKYLFIIDGLDNCGKTTLINDLQNKLSPLVHSCPVVHFPSRDVLNSSEFKLCLSEPSYNRVYDLCSLIVGDMLKTLRTLLKTHNILLIDRFWYSTLMYQGIKMSKSNPFVFHHISRLYDQLFEELNKQFGLVEHHCYLLLSQLDINPLEIRSDLTATQRRLDRLVISNDDIYKLNGTLLLMNNKHMNRHICVEVVGDTINDIQRKRLDIIFEDIKTILN